MFGKSEWYLSHNENIWSLVTKNGREKNKKNETVQATSQNRSRWEREHYLRTTKNIMEWYGEAGTDQVLWKE